MTAPARPSPARPSIEEVLARAEALAEADEARLAAQAPALAEEMLAAGEAVLEAWLEAKGATPTDATREGFRLLALHRQGARGDPGFNACRETCRELVYHRNLILADPDSSEAGRRARLGAMVLRHLALFIGGRLEEAGLGDFCCSSRAVRLAAAPETRSHPA